MAVLISDIPFEIREVALSAKPAEMIAASPKGTVPVLVRPDGGVIDESLLIMRWALEQHDPECWLDGDDDRLIEMNDGPFKHDLDRYKYPDRHAADPLEHRTRGLEWLMVLEARLATNPYLCGDDRSLTDAALMPFVRQYAQVDRAWFDAQHLPAVQRWLARQLDSPLFDQIMIRHPIWQSRERPTTAPA
jgi:glutathione S-transferase